MNCSKTVMELIKERYSCRTYLDQPIEPAARRRLAKFLSSIDGGPLGTPLRFTLVAATEEDRNALRSLGTYGVIRGATGFILGAVGQGAKDLEDFGYRMEESILVATDLGLGSCWLGGPFTRSSFAARMSLRDGEQMPAVTAVGHMAERPGMVDRLIHRMAGSGSRLPWQRLFFDGDLETPISPEAAGRYATPLEMVRLGPSASNKQPWRILRDGEAWHFYLKRDPGYGKGARRIFFIADLQRVDLGIAMSHFELTARELGLQGHWTVLEPELERSDGPTEYVVSWITS